MTGQLRPFLALAARLAWSADVSQRWRQVSVVFAAALLTVVIGLSMALVSAAAAADQRDLDRRMAFAGNDPDPPLWVSARAETWRSEERRVGKECGSGGAAVRYSIDGSR